MTLTGLEIATLFAGIALMQVSPGPNLVAVSAHALGSGRTAGVAAAGGVATGVLVWAVAFALGVGAFIDAVPAALTAVKLAGGAYLTWLGLKALRAATRSVAGGGAGAPRSGVGPRSAFASGLAVVLTNPKAALMWVAISAFLAGGAGPAEVLLIGLGASASAFAIYGVYGILFSTGAAIRAYRRVWRAVDAAFGAVFGALGLRLLWEGMREARSAAASA